VKKISALAVLCLFIAVFQTVSDNRHEPRMHNWEIVTDDPGIPVLPAPLHIPVTVTIYHPVPEQTDSTPNIVASGKKIKIHRARYYRYVAVSRDLHKRWGGPLSFGDIIELKDAGYLSGFYIVEDTMNARFKNHVDVLLSPGDPLAKFPNALLVMTNGTTRMEDPPRAAY